MAPMRSGSNQYLQLAFAAAVVSGIAALTHELLWTRRLIDLLGATHEASARVVACFFLGLSLGSAVIAWFSGRVRYPWRAAALVELLIAAACLPVLFLPQLYAQFWQRLGPAGLVSSHGSIVKLGLSAAVVVPPAFGMGMTIPLMVAGICRTAVNPRAFSIWLYAGNTAGGVLGILAATQWWLWWFGVRGSILVSLLLNVLVAAICLVLNHLDAEPSASVATGAAKSPSGGPTGSQGNRNSSRVNDTEADPRLGVALAFISGLGVLAAEVLCIGLFAHVVSTLNATACVLIAYVAILFFASLIFPLISPRYVSASQLVAPVAYLAAIAICLLPVFFMVVTNDLQRAYDGFGTSFKFVMAILTSVVVTTGPAVLASGLVFPLAVSHFPMDGHRVLRYWGLALAANGVGGALGAGLVSRIVVTRWGLYASFGVVALIYAFIPLAVAAYDRRRRSWLTLPIGVASVMMVWVLWTTVLPALPVVSDQESLRVLATDPGPDGVIAVVESSFALPGGPQVSRSLIWDNQYTLGGTLSRYDEQRQALLPILMHPRPRSVAFLGLATGITAGTALDLPGVEHITVVELSPQVVHCARDYFADFNRHICDDPRATVVVEDARTYVAACTDRFDVVVADLFRPYATGEGRLFSVEHFQAARNALSDGGLYAHWLPCHQLNQAEFEVILASFLQVFGEAEIWRVNLKTQFTAVGLFGFKGGQMSFAGLDEKCRRIRVEGRILDPPGRHAESIAMHYVGLIQQADARSDVLNTLENIWLELHCGLRHCLQDGFDTSMTNAHWLAFEEELYRRTSANRDAAGELASWRSVGRKITRWYYEESRVSRNEQELRRLRADAQQSLPKSLSEDADADWTFWPLF